MIAAPSRKGKNCRVVSATDLDATDRPALPKGIHFDSKEISRSLVRSLSSLKPIYKNRRERLAALLERI